MKEEIKKYTRIDLATEESFNAEFCFPPSFTGFAGHFSEQPVLPGVCLVQAVLVAAEQALGRKLELAEIVLSKFFSVALPDEKLSATIKIDEQMIRAKISRGEDRVAEVRLKVKHA